MRSKIRHHDFSLERESKVENGRPLFNFTAYAFNTVILFII